MAHAYIRVCIGFRYSSMC